MNKLIFILLILVAFTLQAKNIEHVNVGRIAVDDQSLRSQQQAGKKALAQVFVKISGNPQILQAPEISRAVDNYEQFLIASSFLQQQQLIFEATFNQQKIEQLLIASNLSVWTNLRPSAVLWLAKQDNAGHKHVVSQNQSPDISELVQLQAFARGVEIVLPVGDLDDAMNVSVFDVWNQYMSRLLAQSKRYNTDYVVSATMQEFTVADQEALNDFRLAELANSDNTQVSGNIVESNINSDKQEGTSDTFSLEAIVQLPDDALATSENATQTISIEPSIPELVIAPKGTTHKLDYVITNSSKVFTGRLFGTNESSLIQQLVNEYANMLAKEFALGGANSEDISNQQNNSLQLVIDNIRELSDYVDVITLIESIPAVESASLVKQANTTGFFEVRQALGRNQLQAILALDRRIELDTSKQQQAELYFIWLD